MRDILTVAIKTGDAKSKEQMTEEDIGKLVGKALTKMKLNTAESVKRFKIELLNLKVSQDLDISLDKRVKSSKDLADNLERAGASKSF